MAAPDPLAAAYGLWVLGMVIGSVAGTILGFVVGAAVGLRARR